MGFGAGDPEVSVLMPARDAEATLDATLRSVRRQRGVHWECIVVDDGSDDATADVVRRHARADPRVHLIVQERLGLVPALERGRAACRAPFVARMDADDVMHRDRLAIQRAALLDAGDLAGVGCRVRLFPQASRGPGMARYERWINAVAGRDDAGRLDAEAVAREAFVECPLAHPTWMLRRAVLDAHGYRDRGWPEDYDLLLRLLAAGERLASVPRRLLAWRLGAGAHSRTDARYGLDRFTACKAAFLAQGLLAASPAWVLWGHGDTGRALRSALAAHGRTPAAIVEVHPGRIGQVIGGAPVIAPAQLPGERARLSAAGDGSAVPVIASVSGAAARGQIRVALDGMGLAETLDYIMAA